MLYSTPPHTRTQALLDFGMSTNHKDSDGLTPLYVCIVNSTVPTTERCVEMLLFDHAVVGTTDEAGWTELHQVYNATFFNTLLIGWVRKVFSTRVVFGLSERHSRVIIAQ
jgi:hypothetical protein